MYDIIIIGYGPAGCTAGIFAQRRGMKTLILGDMGSLTQVEEATIIDDWPGDSEIKGIDLMEKFRKHVKKLGIEVKEERAIGARKSGKGFSVKTDKNEFQGKTLVIATGSKHRKGIVKGENKFSGKGVSYCATCDAPLFRGKKVAVIGGGDSAVTYALLLQDIGAQTILIHRRDQLRAAETWQKKILKSRVKILWDSVVTEIKGGQSVKSILVMNKKTKKVEEMLMDGVFIALGTIPTSEIAKNIGVKLNEWGFITVDKEQKTNIAGVFAAGDCCDNPSKKIVTAAADGAIAADSAYQLLKKE